MGQNLQMKSSEHNEDRVFVSQNFKLQLHRGKGTRWKTEPRPEHSIFALLSGSALATLNGAQNDIEEGCLVLINPGTAAQVKGTIAAYLSINLSPAFLIDAALNSRLGASGAIVDFRTPTACNEPRLGRVIHDLADELSQEEVGKDQLLTALMGQLAIQLLRNYSTIRRSDSVELSRVGLVDRRIRRAVELMHANLDRDLPLSEIAGAAYLSAFHFSRLFKKLTGATPHAFLGTLRIARAQTLLAETDLSITDIGSRVGYSSSSHFTKAFRDSTGLSPRAFRNAVVRP